MFAGLPERLPDNLDTILVIVVILAGSYIISFLFRSLLGWYQKRFEDSGSRRLSLSMTSFARKLADLLIYGMALIMIFAELKITITPFLAGFGIIGIALALASQELLSNLFGAIAILFDRPFKIGDRITLSSGLSGDVTEVGIRSTKIKTLDNRLIIVPNAKISSSLIDNRSLPDLSYQYTMRFSIAYGADVDKASTILLDIVNGMRGVLDQPAPEVYVEGLGEYSVNLVLLAWVEDFRDSDVPAIVYRQAVKRFSRECIDIPYPISAIRYRQYEAKMEK